MCNPTDNIFGNVRVIIPTTKEGGGQKDKGSRNECKKGEMGFNVGTVSYVT